MGKQSITIKRINNKDYYYLQYREGEKVINRSLSFDEATNMAIGFAHENLLDYSFNTKVSYGMDLYNVVSTIENYRKRFEYEKLNSFLKDDTYGKVFILYGIRRTGKTTMTYQAIRDLSFNDFINAAYIRVTNTNTFEEVDKDINFLVKFGFKYIFIDEITQLEDFISSSSILSDIYGFQAKIVLSGTDSLGFLFATNNELYDRAIMLHTTFIPYKEFNYLLENSSIDQYIEYGGTLSKDGADYNKKVFDGKYQYNEYTNTAIAKNIEHSLRVYQNGNHFSSLKALYEKGELVNVINRLIEDVNHEFAVKTIERDFKSHDYGSLKELLRKEKNTDDVRYALDTANSEQIVSLLMNALEILNKKEREIPISEEAIKEIEEYLYLLDVLKDINYVNIATNYLEKRKVFVEPGLRYAQGTELLEILMNDEEVSKLPREIKTIIKEKLISDIKGRLLEEIVQYHTSINNICFKAIFPVGEYDMVVVNDDEKYIDLYEIKYSTTIDKRQYIKLLDKEDNERIERLYYPIRNRYVL